jgi:putative ABC transport system substrate-binding protein
MKRRDFLGALGVAALPVAARAQQVTVPVIGFLHSGSEQTSSHLVAAFRQGLTDAGYAEGRIAIEYRWANSQYDRLPNLAADLVRRNVSVIFTAGGPPSALAAKNATTTIPIVFLASDPLRFGLVKSLSHPEGNLTGVGLFTASIGSKRLEMLRQLVPAAEVVGFLINPDYMTTDEEMRDMQEAAHSAGIQLEVVRASAESEIDAAFATLAQRQVGALVVAADTAFNNWRRRIITLAAQHRIPAIHFQHEFAADGGLMSYGNNLADNYRQASVYIDRILKGAKPADLPVMQPTKFELVINLKTAKVLGLTVPLSLQVAADEVIE